MVNSLHIHERFMFYYRHIYSFQIEPVKLIFKLTKVFIFVSVATVPLVKSLWFDGETQSGGVFGVALAVNQN